MHILNTSSYSGAENVAVTIIEGFKKMHTDIRSVYVSLDGPIRDVLGSREIEFEPISKLSVGEMKRVIRKYRPTLIHAHDFTASIISALSTLRIPVISHIHNNSPWIKRPGIKSVAYGLSCLRYRRMLGVSPSVFDEFVFGKLFRKKEAVIGNPISVSSIREKAESADCDEKYDVAFIGRLSEAKNPELFVDVISEVSERCHVRAVILGDGELRGDVERKIAEQELENVIALKGFVENPYGYLKNAKVLCMTSSWEGFGLVAAEALALGKPVVATRVGGIPTIVKDGAGYLCDGKDELAGRLSELLTDEELYRNASVAALARGEELDNTSAYIEQLNKIYTEE